MTDQNSRLHGLLKRERHNTIGLMSGTSADGVDLAYCRVDVTRHRLENLTAATIAYPRSLRSVVLEISEAKPVDLRRVASLSNAIGHFYAEAIAEFTSRAGINLSDVDLIGSHGQTICHLSRPVDIGKHSYRGSLQIGEAEVIAKRCNVVTVSDFRAADIAAGGSGAPLLPIYHRHRFAQVGSNRLVVNIGGIANITVLAGEQECRASDTGPGNCLVDHLLSRLTGEQFDAGGGLALSGRVDRELLRRLQAGGIFTTEPPYSLDRGQVLELLGDLDIDSLLTHIVPADLVATVAALTPWSIQRTCSQLAPGFRPDQVLVCGGGALNEFFMNSLRNGFHDSTVSTTAPHGSDPEFVEAEGFAYLANLTLAGLPGNLAEATVAEREVVLGKVSQP